MISLLGVLLTFQNMAIEHRYKIYKHRVRSAAAARRGTGHVTICSMAEVGLPCPLHRAGGWIADRWTYERPVIMMVSSLVQTISPLVNAFYPNFTAVCVTMLVNGIVSGLTGSASKGR
eukprot:SAG11_NODE_2538_length_3243_cov_1.535623_4_plen_118_part_00